MKDFFKAMLRSVLSCFLVLLVVFLIFFISIASFSFSEQYKLKDNTILTLNLEGELSERVENDNPLLAILGQVVEDRLGLDDILSSIKKAKENDKIKGIYIQAGAFSAQGASLKEIRDELLDFKKSGKFIVAYADLYTQDCYYISSVADKVILNPQGELDLHGYAITPMFYKGLLDKVGVEMQIFKVGTFKSAVELFMLDKMSDANHEQVADILNDMWLTILSEISTSRNISVDKLNLLVDSLMKSKEASAILAEGLVDTLMYETGVNEYLKTLLEVEKVKDVNLASVKEVITIPAVKDNKSEDIIAVLYAEGTISDGTGKDGITSKRYIKEIEKLRDNDNIKAVVFRINSGGGSAYASEEIWEAMGRLKEKKPIVVSMGDYAASGGYYIACNANKIIAQPNTLTGSIGVFGMIPNVEGLTRKIGVSFDVAKTNKYSDFGDLTRPMRKDEKDIVQNYIERGYDLFLTRCSDGRGIPRDSLEMFAQGRAIAQGRVWTGNQALEIGLIDKIGGIDTAIEEVVKLAGLDNYALESFPKKTNFFESFFSNQKEEMAAQAIKEYLGADYQHFKILKEIKEQNFIQARMPYDMLVK